MRLHYLTNAIAVAALAVAPAIAGPQQANRTMTTGQSFAQDLAQANIAEIELGKLAQHKGSLTGVKELGARLVNDHTQMNNQLKEWARTNHVTLPTHVSSTQADQKRKLEGLSGQAFDRAYLDYMLSDHAHDVKQVQEMALNAQDPQVKQLAEKCLPKLEDHLRMAENIAGQAGISADKGLNESQQQ